YFITSRIYRRSRRYSMYGFGNFVDHDSWAMVFAFVLSLIAGIAMAYLWPLVIEGIKALFAWIGNDITNPINLFVYGIFERLSAPLGLLNIPREVFWFSELGGSWMDAFGVTYLGDVSIYAVQQNLTTMIGTAGRFITPYYIINMFLIPAFYMGYYSLVSDKKDKRRYIKFFVIALLISILCGNPLPVEIYMLFMAPVLYVFYLFIVGVLYAVLAIFNVLIGFNFNGMLMVAMPGSAIDLIQHLRNPEMYGALVRLAVIGLGVSVLFYILTRMYFKKYAIGFFEMHTVESTCDDIIFDLGGLENILQVHSTPDKLMVDLKDKSQVDLPALQSKGAYLIFESKEGFLIRLGNISTIVKEQIDLRLFGPKPKRFRKGR
ncbi:MAG: hypothetical protein ACRDBX_08335, partial [Erysipelotrichaceae bacterium]